MNWDQIKGNWHQLKGTVKAHWGRLTDDELERIAGDQERLVGVIQERYGITREEAEKQVSGFDWRL
ncbi:CsbD family protein [Candidatus Methylocalor cossyra]|uniref:Stress response protein n=1 Tax=Candidatus Methylocalor cossyra TaxID=3108543 RepID=A0ABP1C6D8_9GAMM